MNVLIVNLILKHYISNILIQCFFAENIRIDNYCITRNYEENKSILYNDVIGFLGSDIESLTVSGGYRHKFNYIMNMSFENLGDVKNKLETWLLFS